jgi:serine protease inhibitor
MKVILAFLFALVAPVVHGAVEPEAAARAYNRFGFELLAQARKKADNKNLFLSPASLAFALSMVQHGARAETLRQMAAMLHVETVAPEELNAANKTFLDHLTSLDPKLKLEIANALWMDKDAAIEPEFTAVNKSAFNAEVFSADFRDPSLVDTINKWASDHTEGKIPIFLDRVDRGLRLIVVDAIYFKGLWVTPFDRSQTRDLPFSLAGGQVVQHPRMRQSGKFSYVEGSTFQAVELPYAGGEMSMIVILPKGGLDEFLPSLTMENFERWTEFMRPHRGTVELPRFKLQNSYDLNGILKAMGMELAFTPQADFSGISSRRLWIDWVKQKTYVDVNEEGTEAAAVTGLGVRGMAVIKEPPPFRMVVDHPFLVALRDRKTGLILFLGVISDPR